MNWNHLSTGPYILLSPGDTPISDVIAKLIIQPRIFRIAMNKIGGAFLHFAFGKSNGEPIATRYEAYTV